MLFILLYLLKKVGLGVGEVQKKKEKSRRGLEKKRRRERAPLFLA